VNLFCVVRKITASRGNRRELLGNELMKTASQCDFMGRPWQKYFIWQI